MKKIILFYAVILFLFGCGYTSEQKQKINLSYFDVKGYFENEVNRLQKSSPAIYKMVEVNGSTETKTVKITDWKKELAIFSEADINKDSWKGLFKIIKQADKETYVSDNEKVPIKEIEITYTSSKEVSKLLIIVKNNNSLYTSADSLFYYPDSVYKIVKSQKIKLLSDRNYKVTGRFR
ncbi:hypothetical protein [Pedobacter frigoris]|uniref:Uncharacterized protein n=1 Tax=Pedobacter frigoris TaxID=2571272 RepID=A0A4U1CBB3_9SPHI|nr:hypothetical protein [Pedobacter frigoris]TKC03863.1 hypothetical protein FA047_18065 [Pedobacter frigoris]